MFSRPQPNSVRMQGRPRKFGGGSKSARYNSAENTEESSVPDEDQEAKEIQRSLEMQMDPRFEEISHFKEKEPVRLDKIVASPGRLYPEVWAYPEPVSRRSCERSNRALSGPARGKHSRQAPVEASEFDQGTSEKFNGRINWEVNFRNNLQKLMLDFDLSSDPTCRLNHLDRVHDWFQSEGKKNVREEKATPSFLTFDKDVQPLPGSARDISARLAGLRMAPRGSCLALGLLLRGALALRSRIASPEADDIHKGGYYKQELGNVHNVQYYGNMKIGGQTLTVILDTGSFEIVVFSRNCPTCGMAAEFNEGASPTFEWGGHTQTHAYGSGSCQAKDGFDNVAIGTISSEKQPLWIAVNCQIPILATASFNVIAGMGPPGQPEFSANSQMKKIEEMEKQFEKNGEAVPDELKKLREDTEKALQVAQGKKAMLETLGVRTFSHCLGKEAGSPGYLIWNDETRAGRPGVQQIPVAGNITWGVVMKDIALASDSSSINVGCSSPSCGAIIDSGTSLFAFPTAMYNAVVLQLQSMGPSLDCSDLSVFPDLVLNLGGQTLRFPPSSYIGRFDGQMSKDVEDFVRTDKFSAPEARVPCQLLLMDLGPAQQTTLGPMVILGMPFFREYYTTFDLGEGRGDRSLLVSKASGDCSPEVSAVAAAREGNLRYTPLTVDLSALRPPLWLRRGNQIGVAAV